MMSYTRPPQIEYEGFVLYGFESMIFAPDLTQQDEPTWVRFERNLGETYSQMNDDITPIDHPAYEEGVWVRAKGRMESGGGFGHLGQYQSQFTVTEILESSKAPILAHNAQVKDKQADRSDKQPN